MKVGFPEERMPKFYGAVTVGERGQVVIPSEARGDFEIKPADKLLVFGGPHGDILILAKAESVTEFMAKAMGMLARIEETVNADKADQGV